MAKITPLDEIPDFTKHQLQQILLERDESVERLATIAERDAEIAALKAEKDQIIADAATEKNKMATDFSNLQKQLVDEGQKFKEQATALLSDNQLLSDKLKSVEGTPEFIAAKLAQAEELKKKAQEIEAKFKTDK